MAGTWLEVALNGGWGRALQPNIPVSVDEIIADGIACAREGAAIIHLHAYDEATGRQRDDADLYARIIEAIRAETDAIVYPTIDAGSAPGSELSRMGADRYRAVETLGARGLLEWSVVDPGSVNLTSLHAITNDQPGSVYMNPESDIRTGLALAVKYGFHPSYAIYEPGFLRLGAALAKRYPSLKQSVYRLMFSDGMAFGFKPRPYAVEAYLAMLADHAPGAPWMIAGLMADVTPLIEMTVAHGGHIRTGLEDVRLGTAETNLTLVRQTAKAIAEAGGTLATPAEIRRRLAS